MNLLGNTIVSMYVFRFLSQGVSSRNLLDDDFPGKNKCENLICCWPWLILYVRASEVMLQRLNNE